MITLHGISNCDTVRKARRWLQQHNIDYRFRDLRADPPSTAEIDCWLQRCDWSVLLNKRSTTWKGLSEADRAGVTDASTAAPLLAANPTLIKRPLLQVGDTLNVGFNADTYSALFAA